MWQTPITVHKTPQRHARRRPRFQTQAWCCRLFKRLEVKLTLHGQVSWSRGGYAQAVTRAAGIFPSILWLHSVDNEGSINKDAHTELQITEGKRREMICLKNIIKCICTQRRTVADMIPLLWKPVSALEYIIQKVIVRKFKINVILFVKNTSHNC